MRPSVSSIKIVLFSVQARMAVGSISTLLVAALMVFGSWHDLVLEDKPFDFVELVGGDFTIAGEAYGGGPSGGRKSHRLRLVR